MNNSAFTLFHLQIMHMCRCLWSIEHVSN